jgi:hypothetical protein
VKHVTSIALLAILTASSCEKPNDAVTVSRDGIVGGIDLAIVEQALPGAMGTIEHGGSRYVLTGPAWHVQLSEMHETEDDLGFRAIIYTVAPSDAAEFSTWTAENTGHVMAVLIRDEEVCIATLAGGLHGQGIIADRYDSTRIKELMVKIAANR